MGRYLWRAQSEDSNNNAIIGKKILNEGVSFSRKTKEPRVKEIWILTSLRNNENRKLKNMSNDDPSTEVVINRLKVLSILNVTELEFETEICLILRKFFNNVD